MLRGVSSFNKDTGILRPRIRKGYLFDAGTCCTVCREGTPISRNTYDGHRLVLTSLLSGKTSLILSLAGELGLDIYSVSLSSKGMTHNTLMTLMGSITSPCILLFEDLDAAFDRVIDQDSTSTFAPTVPTMTVVRGNEANEGSTLSSNGFLSCLDWAVAAKAQLLFATTNHIERIDPVLSRPGRMDIWVNFPNATRSQAECIFKRFFLPGPSASSSGVPILEEAEIAQLAERFADEIPEGEISVASLQGYLLKNKSRPRACVEEVAEWVQQEREARVLIQRE